MHAWRQCCSQLLFTQKTGRSFLAQTEPASVQKTGLINEIPVIGPRIVWRAKLGVGMSNLAIAGDTVFTLYQDEAQQYVAALNAENGKQLWQVPIAPMYKNSMGNGPRATPTVTDDAAFVFTGDGVLAAVDITRQKLKWRVDTCGSLACKPADYGMSASPLLVGDTVVVNVGSVNGSVAGYDATTGEQQWATGSSPCGYSSPVLLQVGGESQIVAFAGDAVMGLSTKGEKLWNFPYVTDYNCNTANPIALSQDTILISAGENHGSAILKISKSGEEWSAKEEWSSGGKDSVLRAEWQTPILHDGFIYGLDNVGSAGAITNLVCVNAESREQVWIEKRFGKSNFTLADGKLFLTTMRGELVIVKATPDGFEELGRHIVLNGMTRQAPAIANGRLFMRDDAEVVCVDIRK